MRRATQAALGTLATVLLATGLVVLPAGEAGASCAESPSPSPEAFEGTVIATEDGDRTAIVVTEDGTRVTVAGGTGDGQSSVDRRYAVGALYEFHPVNDRSPYRDNICTATRKLWGPDLSETEPRQGILPAWLPVDEQAGLAGYLAFFGPLGAGGLLITVLAVVLHRRRTRLRFPPADRQLT